CILKDGAIEFSRRLPVAGEDITKAMTGVLVSDLGRLEFEMDEVERLKKKCGIPGKSQTQMAGEKVSAAQILSLIRPSIEKLSNEISRSFDYYRGSSQGGNVDRAILFGGSAGLKGLTEYLSDKLRMEVDVGDPLKWVKVLSGAVDKKEIVSHRLGVAMGAVLGAAGGINLLPSEVKEETRRLIERAGIKAVATALILLLLFLYIGMRLQLVNYSKRISSGKVELLSLKQQIKEARKQLQINRILIHEPYWIEAIKEISNVVPPNIYITEISMQEGKEGVKEITLCGIILAGEEATLASLSRLMLTLERGIFKNVALITTRKYEEIEGSSMFKLKGEIDYSK
ncbi:MAG: pilus assembly protein PilM, partial [Candidatus Omnitrophota bacterium]|nr:pilus assembly protein PilM [Candidatus Omnitrophota bacterium]